MKRSNKLTTVVLGLSLLSLPSLGARESSSEAKAFVPAESPRRFAVDLQYTGLRWAGLPVERTAEGQLYSGYGHGGRIAFEYLPIQSIGTLGIGAGVTVYGQKDIALGADRFTSIVGVPVDFSLSYRAVYSPTQILIPFAKGGVGAVGIRQTSKTGGPNEVTQTEGTLNWGAGLIVNLGVLDPKDRRLLDRQSGVNGIYLVLEYNRSKMVGASALNLSYESFQAGLRFEL